ncbi:MAG: O-antigen ligase family protein [Anaerolineae bacterium]|nr:O-antigen ligase family protein [Anaerolineae bacterium]
MNHKHASVPANAHLQRMQEIVWYLLAIVPPLWVNLWGQQPFELSKALLMRTLVWLLAGLVLVEWVVTGRSLRSRLLANPLLGPTGVLAAVLLVTTMTSVDRSLSLWGSYERAQGLLTLLTYLLLALLAAYRLQPLRRATALIRGMAATGAPLVLLGVLEGLGWNPFGLVSDARSPLYATLGRSNFLGAYLVILAPLTLAQVVTTADRRRRLLWASLFAGELAVIGLTLARSAWLAGGVALGVFALLYWQPRLARRWRRVGWGVSGLLFLGGPLAVLILGERLLGSTAARLTVWKATLALIARRPLLGYGADTLDLVFTRVYRPELVYYQGREFYVDRAHNLLLDWAVMAGVPGLLAFLLVLATFVLVVARALREPDGRERRVLLAAVLASVIGNVANNMMSFDVTPTATASWLLIGLGVALAVPERQHVAAPIRRVPQRGRAVGAFVVAMLAVVMWQVNARPFTADIAARASSRYAVAGNWEQAVAAAETAVRRWPVEPAHHQLLGEAYWRRAAADPERASLWLSKAEGAFVAARELRPGDAAVWLRAAQFYRAAAVQFGSPTRGFADDAYRRALALAPNHATVYAAWGQTYLDDGDAQRAAELLRQAVWLDASHGEAYLYLAAAEQALGRLGVALADYREAARLLPDSAAAYAGIAYCHWQLDQPQAALAAAEAALQRDPGNVQAATIAQATAKRP